MDRTDLIFWFPRLKPFILDGNYWDLGLCIFVTYFEAYRWSDYLFDRLDIFFLKRTKNCFENTEIKFKQTEKRGIVVKSAVKSL